MHREYIAVSSISNYDLLEEILVPPQRDKPNYDDAYLERAIAAYRVNRPQAAAIVSSLAAKGFSLIQGYVRVLCSFSKSDRCSQTAWYRQD